MSDSLTYTFDHVHLFCSDLQAMERWFVAGMGAQLVRRRVAANGALAIDLRLGGVGIFLRGPAPGETPGKAEPSRLGTNHFGLVVQDLQAAVQELKRRGVEFESEPREISPRTRVAFARGPDEVRIELLQRGQ